MLIEGIQTNMAWKIQFLMAFMSLLITDILHPYMIELMRLKPREIKMEC